jgi:septal ring factor EnvC (AmiA/AmiB activator)
LPSLGNRRRGVVDERRNTMASTILKRIVMCAALAACALGVSGCAARPYEVRAADERKQAEEARRDAESRLKALEQEKEKVAQLQKDLDAVKIGVEKANRAVAAAEARITKLEKENADLKKRIPNSDSSNQSSTPDDPDKLK